MATLVRIPLLVTLLVALSACRTGETDKGGGVGTDTGGLDGVDEDGDGFPAGEDCDDDDASINGGAAEVCDGIDNDCDGEIDEGVINDWYVDADGDGYGNPEEVEQSCSQPEGTVTNGGDCDDENERVHPAASELCNEIDDNCDGEIDEGTTTAYYADADEDGHGDPDVWIDACEQPDGFVEDNTDCDDREATSYPGATEVCDELDNDCDGFVDEDVTTTYWVDRDDDDWGDAASSIEACEEPVGYANQDGDCDDNDDAVSPSATEICDLIDNDCDGTIDEPDATDASTWYDDADSDSFGNPDISTLACEQPSGMVADDTDCDDTLSDVNPAATEICNEIDDDCDGTIDEPDATDASTWYIDADSDTYGSSSTTTVACDQPSGFVDNDDDCDDSDASIHPSASEDWYDGIDSDCDGDEEPDPCGSLPGASTVADDPTCGYTGASSSSWSVVTEWYSGSMTYSAGTSYTRIMMTPVVGQLTDDDGDGDIDENDMPDIAYTTFTSSSYGSAGYLRVMSGDGSGEHWSKYSFTYGGSTHYLFSSAGVAIGDLENDGEPEIVTLTTGYKVVAFTGDGTAKWVSSATVGSAYAAPSIHDLDGDGQAEVIVGDKVLDTNGTTLASLSSAGLYVSFAADFDLDGTMDIITGDKAFEMNGTTSMTSTATSGRMAIANLDSDSAAEIIVRYDSSVKAIDHTGTVLWSATTDVGQGAPCVGDFDGDGDADLAVAGRDYFDAFNSSGTRLWRKSINDTSSRSAGCTVFDFDGDGDVEVLYADQIDFYILDGATGTQLYKNTNHASGTLWEYPLVADVDNDGNAEIVIPNNNYAYSGWDGLYVLGEANDEWASARPVWNQYAYSSSNVNDDASIPATPDSSWLDHNSFRGQVAASELPDGAPDLGIYILGVCEDCAAGSIELYAAVDNSGAVFAPAGVGVALYSMDGITATLLDVQSTTSRVDPGIRLAPMTFVVDEADIGPDGLIVVVDDDGTGLGAHNECDESNNDDAWDALSCP